MAKKKEEHTTFEVGPISEPRMRDIMDGVWRGGGTGRAALRTELIGWTFRYESFPFENEALIPHRGYLYIVMAPSGEIYRFDGDTWTLVWSAKEAIPVTDPFIAGWHAALWATTRFSKDSYLYVGGEHFQKPYGKNIILRHYKDDFQVIDLGGYDTNEIVSLYEFQGSLYAGERPIGGSAPPGTTAGWLWRSVDGLTWNHVWMEPGQRGLTVMEQYQANLYLGTEGPLPSKIYSFDGTTATEVISDPEIHRFKSMATFKGKLWVGGLTTDYKLALFSFDGTTWDKLVFDFNGLPYSMLWSNELMLIGMSSEFGSFGYGQRGSGKILAFDGVRLWEVLTLPGIGVSRMAPYAGSIYFGTHAENVVGVNPSAGPTADKLLGKSIGIYRLDPKDFVYPIRLPPRTHYFYDVSDRVKVKAKAIGVGGFTSCTIPIIGFASRTIYLLSDQAGTINIDIDQYGDGDWQAYVVADAVTANTLYRASITGDAAYLRIDFTPALAASVTAKLVLS